MKRFLMLALLIPVVFGVVEATQWWREPSILTWIDRSWFAIGGAGLAIFNAWVDP